MRALRLLEGPKVQVISTSMPELNQNGTDIWAKSSSVGCLKYKRYWERMVLRQAWFFWASWAILVSILAPRRACFSSSERLSH